MNRILVASATLAAALSVLASGLAWADPANTSTTLSFDPSSPVSEGTFVDVTGMVACAEVHGYCSSLSTAINVGTIQIRQAQDSSGNPVACEDSNFADYATIASGTPVGGAFTLEDFDTSGFGGQSIGFQAHYVPGGGGGHRPGQSMGLCYDLMVTTADALPDGTISYGQGYYGSAPIGEYSVGLLIDGLDICSDVYAALTDVDGVPSFGGCELGDYEGIAYFLTGDVGHPGGGGNNDGGFLPSGFLPGQNLAAQTITLLLNLNWDPYLPEGEHAIQDSYYLNIDPVQDWVDGEAGPIYDPILTTGGELGTCTDSEPHGVCDGAASLTDLGQKVQGLDIAGTTVGDILATALDLLENGNDPQDVHGVSLSAGDLTAILGLINESYEDYTPTGFVTLGDID